MLVEYYRSQDKGFKGSRFRGSGFKGCGFALLNLFNIIDNIQSFDSRPARNALKLVRSKFYNLIHNSMITLTHRTMHGRRVFMIRYSIFIRLEDSLSTNSHEWVSFPIRLAAFQASGGAEPLNL